MLNAALALGGALAVGGVVYAVAKPKAATAPAPPNLNMACPWAPNGIPTQSYIAQIIIATGDFIAGVGGVVPQASSIATFQNLTPACFMALPATNRASLRQAAVAYTLTNNFGSPAYIAAQHASQVAGPVPATGVGRARPLIPGPAVRRPAPSLSRFVRSRVTGLGV